MKAQQLKYAPSIWAAISYIGLFLLVFLLFMGRSYDALKNHMLLSIFPDLYSHISNFSISFMIYLIVGYLWTLMGVSMRYILFAGIAIVVINFIYELFLPILNTRDVADAVYGTAGTLFCLIYIIVLRRYGLRPLPEKKN